MRRHPGAPRAWLLLVATLFATRCAAAITVVDDTGATVALAAPAQRILTLAPHAAELVDAAGAAERIVGVVKGTDRPAAARGRPLVGDAAALDLERIVTLRPDLVVTWPWTVPAQVAWLRARGIAVFEADPRTLDGIPADVERIGELTATKRIASAAATALRRRIARLAPGDPERGTRVRVFYQLSAPPLFTLGGGHLVSRAIERCGGENVFAALAIPAPEVSVEAVLAARPQVIIAGTDEARRPQWLDAWSRWPALDAVRDGNLFVVDANLLHRPGPRFVDGVEQLCRVLGEARGRLAHRGYNDDAGVSPAAAK